MSTAIRFTNQPGAGISAMKLNRMIADLEAEITSAGSGSAYSDQWDWTTSTSDAATSGDLGINAATSWPAATALNINKTSATGRDLSLAFNELFVAPNEILVQLKGDSTRYGLYTISGSATDHGTWSSFPVTAKQSGGALPGNNAAVNLTVLVKGGGGGDMTKAVYDTNNNGKVDTCDSLAWGSVTGKPSTFPPDSTAELIARKGQPAGYAGLDASGKVPTAQLPAFGTGDMAKAVYDTNNNGVVDTCDSLAWSRLSGAPATFPPSAHASTHNLGGSDAIAPDWSQIVNKPTLTAGTWATPAFATGWSAGTPGAAYRVQNFAGVQSVFFRGVAVQAAGAASLAFTLPAGALPSAARTCLVAGYQTDPDASLVLALYAVTIATGGAVNIYPVVKLGFVWTLAANQQNVYLDSLNFSI